MRATIVVLLAVGAAGACASANLDTASPPSVLGASPSPESVPAVTDTTSAPTTTIVAPTTDTPDTAAPTTAPTTAPTIPAPTTTMVAPTTLVPVTAAPTTAPTTVPTTAPATSTTPHPTRRVAMAFTGDILPHSPLWRAAERYAAEAGVDGHDFAPMLAALGPIHDSVDLAVCHLETPVAPEGEDYSTHPLYAVPAGIAAAIADARFDRCSTASNHTIDRGAAGIDRTVSVLEEHGIAQVGMARTPDEIAPRTFEVAGVTVSHLSYTWSYNGLSLPESETWRSALIDPDRVLADAAAARALGAELVIVSLHWGAEGHIQPTPYQRTIAEQITAAGTVDLIVGHHAHVIQPIEQVNGVWVLYGTSNILSNLPTSSNFPDASQDAAVFLVDAVVDEDGVVTVERPRVVPTWVDKDARWTVRLVPDELARDDLNAGQRSRLEQSLARTTSVVGDFVVASPSAP